MRRGPLVGGAVMVPVLAAVACITLPPPLERAEAEAVVSAGGAGGYPAGGNGGAGGGASHGALPICAPGEASSADCATIAQLAPGTYHTCILASDGHVWCWGSNLSGELGDPARPKLAHLAPGVVPGLSDVDAVVAGNSYSCALVGSNAYCWGANDLGQLGTGNTEPRDVPTPLPLPNVKLLESNKSRSLCAVTHDNRIYCWGRLLNGQDWTELMFTAMPTEVPLAGDMSIGTLDLGGGTGCVLSDDRTDLRCWGANGSGYVGDGTTETRLTATPVASTLATPVHLLDAGSARRCTVGGTPRRLQCWGDVFGEIYVEPTDMTVIDPSAVQDVQLGWGSLCFHETSENVACMGFGHFGELGVSGGDGENISTPVDVIGGVTDLVAGWTHNCAILAPNEVRCWGSNEYGQVKPGDLVTEIRSPAQVSFAAE